MDKEELYSKIDKYISENFIGIDDLTDVLNYVPIRKYTSYQDHFEEHDKRYFCEGLTKDPCIYCGEESKLWDHIPPLIVLETTEYNGRCIKVRSCYRCNSTLKDLRLNSIIQRKEYLKGIYQKQLEILQRRLKHLSKLNDWF